MAGYKVDNADKRKKLSLYSLFCFIVLAYRELSCITEFE